MEKRINNIAFSPEEVEAGAVKDLLGYLLEYNSNSDYDDYYEIHITTDSYCTIVEFEKVPYNGEWGGRFKYVEPDEAVMKEYMFPDNHFEYYRSEEEYKEALDEWLEENPGWEKTDYNRWVYNDRRLSEDLEKDMEVRNKLVEDLKGRYNNEQ